MKIILVLLFLLNCRSYAGHETGNGGDVVVCDKADNKEILQLLDYYEAPFRKFEINISATDDVNTTVLSTIERIGKFNNLMKFLLIKKYTEFKQTAVYLPGIELTDIPDSKEIFLNKGCKIAQIAINQRDRIGDDPKYIVSKDLWDAMDNRSKAGLILHEIIYDHFLDIGAENSRKARYFNSYLSSKKIGEDDSNEFNSKLIMLGLNLWQKPSLAWADQNAEEGTEMLWRVTSNESLGGEGECSVNEINETRRLASVFHDQYLIEVTQEYIYKSEALKRKCSSVYPNKKGPVFFTTTSKAKVTNDLRTKIDSRINDLELWCKNTPDCVELKLKDVDLVDVAGIKSLKVTTEGKFREEDGTVSQMQLSKIFNSVAPYLGFNLELNYNSSDNNKKSYNEVRKLIEIRKNNEMINPDYVGLDVYKDQNFEINPNSDLLLNLIKQRGKTEDLIKKYEYKGTNETDSVQFDSLISRKITKSDTNYFCSIDLVYQYFSERIPSTNTFDLKLKFIGARINTPDVIGRPNLNFSECIKLRHELNSHQNEESIESMKFTDDYNELEVFGKKMN